MTIIHEPLSMMAALTLGLLGGAHCIGMCGGITGAIATSVPLGATTTPGRFVILLAFNLGRIAAYGIAGAAAGALGGWLQAEIQMVTWSLRLAAAALLIAMGCYLAGWWMGLRYLEIAGGRLWRYIKPLTIKLLPADRPSRCLLLGFFWGWLPCGLVYSVLTWSLTTATWYQSAVIMIMFGLGTMPVMLLSGHLAMKTRTWLQGAAVRNSAAVALVLFGIWTLYGALAGHGNMS